MAVIVRKLELDLALAGSSRPQLAFARLASLRPRLVQPAGGAPSPSGFSFSGGHGGGASFASSIGARSAGFANRIHARHAGTPGSGPSVVSRRLAPLGRVATRASGLHSSIGTVRPRLAGGTVQRSARPLTSSSSAAPAAGAPAATGPAGLVVIGQLVLQVGGAAAAGSTPTLARERALVRGAGADATGAPFGFEQLIGASSGFALPSTLGGRLGGLLGSDLSGVRIHTGHQAIRANDSIGSLAFASGNDIFFGAGQYDPGSARGLSLLAHELTHVAQGRGGANTLSPRRSAGAAGGRLSFDPLPVQARGLEVAGHDRFETQALSNERAVYSLLSSGGGLGALPGLPSDFGATPSGGGTVRTRGLGGPERFYGGHLERIQRRAREQLRRSALLGGIAGRLAPSGLVVEGGESRGSISIERLTVVWPEAQAQRGGNVAPRSMELAYQPMGLTDDMLAPAGFEQVLARSSGANLPDALRARMEGLFGVGFADVRVHTDQAAAQAAAAIGAQAFALGGDIYFGAGFYDPRSPRGISLIGHELTHIAQERGGAVTLGGWQTGAVERMGGGREAPHLRELRVAGQDMYERQALANERAVYGLFSAGRGAMLPGSFLGGDGASLAGAMGMVHARRGPLLARSAGYPGALARRAEDEAGSAVVPAPSDGVIDEAVGLFRQVGPLLGAVADVGIGFIPVVGDIYDVLCGVVGRALFTWEQLDVFERILCIAGVIPLPFISGAILRRGKRVLAWALKKMGVDAGKLLARAIGLAIGFVKKGIARLKGWIHRLLLASHNRFEALGKRIRTKLNAVRQGSSSEAVKALEEGVEELQALIQKAGLKTVNVESYFEYKALRMQGFNAKEAMELLKRFRAGEAVEGFGWHFTNKVGGKGITDSGTLRVSKGYLGTGVYLGSTPTPSSFQKNVPLIGWGIGSDSNVRIPVKLEGKQAFESVLPTKTYLVEVSEHMPLNGSIEGIMRKDPALLKLFYRYRTLVFAAAAGFAGVGMFWPILQSLFLKKRGGDESLADQTDTETFANRLRRRRQDRDISRLGPGLGLERSVRDRLELALGTDVGDVRLHTGLKAERLAQTFEAEAFTFGKHVFMGQGTWNSDSPEGLGVLAHEVTHVVQEQKGMLHGPQSPARTRALEQQAYGVERNVVQAQPLRPAPRAPYAGSTPKPVFRESQGTFDVPVPDSALRGGKVHRKEITAQRGAGHHDAVRKVMDEYQVRGMSREEFVQLCKERIMDLMADELELDNERRETLAWNPYLPLA